MSAADRIEIDSVRRRQLLTLPLAAAVLPTPAFAAQLGDPMVECASGRFVGRRSDGVRAFLGIRYGASTVQTRFTAPVRAKPAGDTVRAREYGSSCPQRGKTPTVASEDCLFLNVWAPDGAEKRPVMVYFHGGAYNTGSGNEPVTEGVTLAARGNVIVVTVTHRLNAFGYLYLAPLIQTLGDSGNAGQLDLVLALQWVRDNITAFGGNPGNVTVFGQSGGGAKIATLMAMPAAEGLFHRAATMSGQQVTASGPQNALRRARAFLATLKQDPLTAPMAALTDALATVDPVMGGSIYFGPVLDGRNLKRHPFYPDAPRQSHGIPMLLGNTVSETGAFFPPTHPLMRALDWDNIAERIAPELRVDIDPQQVIRQYRAWYPDDTPTQLWIRATTASRSWRGQIVEAEARAAAGVPAYVYQLDFEDARHTDDIALVFGNIRQSSPAARAMSDRMMKAFIRFAESGTPGWEPYELPARRTMIFDSVSTVRENPRGREREFFATVPYIQPGT